MSEILPLISEIADEKQALDISILDLRQLTYLAEYFYICSGDSTTQVRAIAEGLVEKLKKANIRLWHYEGMEDSRWVLLDFGSVIVHIFYRETRDFYNLESIWANAPKLKEV